MDRLPYSAAPSGERTTIVCGMASTIPRASCSDNDAVAVKVLISLFSVPAGWTRVLDIRGGTVTGHRSEEHTSELQSLAYLVCRLLLEKKKKTRWPIPSTPTSCVVRTMCRWDRRTPKN